MKKVPCGWYCEWVQRRSLLPLSHMLHLVAMAWMQNSYVVKPREYHRSCFSYFSENWCQPNQFQAPPPSSLEVHCYVLVWNRKMPLLLLHWNPMQKVINMKINKSNTNTYKKIITSYKMMHTNKKRIKWLYWYNITLTFFLFRIWRIDLSIYR